jgi:FkbH-like protein
MNLLNCLEFPLNTDTILRKKKAIKKQLLDVTPNIEKNIAILGGSTTAEIRNILELFLLKKGIKANFYESEYNQYYEDALFGDTKLTAFNPDIIYVHTTSVNVVQFPGIEDSEAVVNGLFDQEIERYHSIWRSLSQYDCAIIQNNFDLPADRSLGNLDFSELQGKTHFINKLNLAFAESARKLSNLFINDINYLSATLGIQNWFDRNLWYLTKYALSYSAIPSLALNLSNIINAIFGQTKKCLVLDLDNTLWGGVIGDDGLHGITIGKETALGEAYTDFQRYAKELKQRGVPLAVCSKNDAATAKEGLMHKDNLLTCSDMTSFKANWEPKHQNIQDISRELNIHTDSLVFLDDNPAERALVTAQIPEVAVPDIGDNIVHYIDYLDKSGYFEPACLSSDDKQRTAYYQRNKQRVAAQASFNNYHEYLKSLQMEAEIQSFSPLYHERITQLINKTNQFNLTTKRFTLGEVEATSENDQQIKLYGRLIDKYGDNGLIAITVASIYRHQCHINLWLMSCRVLKRDMELAMLDRLVDCCIKKGITEIIGYFYQSKKNKMVSELYKQLGFALISQNQDDTVWCLPIHNYKNLNSTIKVNND